MKQDEYVIYINPEWHNPVVTHSSCDDPWFRPEYYSAGAVLRVSGDRILLLRNIYRDQLIPSGDCQYAEITKQHLTMLKLGAIPPGLIDLLTSPVICTQRTLDDTRR